MDSQVIRDSAAIISGVEEEANVEGRLWKHAGTPRAAMGDHLVHPDQHEEKWKAKLDVKHMLE